MFKFTMIVHRHSADFVKKSFANTGIQTLDHLTCVFMPGNYLYNCPIDHYIIIGNECSVRPNRGHKTTTIFIGNVIQSLSNPTECVQRLHIQPGATMTNFVVPDV